MPGSPIRVRRFHGRIQLSRRSAKPNGKRPVEIAAQNIQGATIKLVDVTGIEPVTPCLQRTEGKTLTALFGVAHTENQPNFRSLKYPEVIPNLWCARSIETGGLEKLNRRFAI